MTLANIKRNNLVFKYKSFVFPVSITEFSIKEEAKVATYEYAWRNGAEHERVLNYRTFSLSGTFTYSSGEKTPAYYANRLRLLNNNEPWLFVHPTFGAYRCIIKSLDITESGEELEFRPDASASERSRPDAEVFNNLGWTGRGFRDKKASIAKEDHAVPNYKFSIEFWEHTPPNAATLDQTVGKLFPAAVVKPLRDWYESKLKYKTVDQLYEALVNKKILPWLDPVRNAEWLYYNLEFRKAAYDRFLADPDGKSLMTAADTRNATAENKLAQIYTVKAGDTASKIALKLNVSTQALFEKNSGRKVRTVSKWIDWLFWKRISALYPWDTLLVP